MAQYRTHTRFNLILALPVLLGITFYTLHPERPFLITFGIAFIYATLFMNPDLDLAHQIKLFSIRGLLSIPFRLYSRVFKHRGLSHHPFLGSLTRILWLALWALISFYLINRTLPNHKSLIQLYLTNKSYFFYGFAGIFFADLSHLLLDV